jgi:hypothetical protein
VNAYVTISRPKFNHARTHTKGKGLSIEVHLPDEWAEDDVTYERIMDLVGKRLREKLQDGVFKGTTLTFTLD